MGLGLGMQNIVNNFVAGLILLFERPLKVGDKITMGSTSGQVLDIHKVGDTGEKIVIKTKNGTEEAYDVSKKAVVTSGKKIGEISKVVANKTVEGTKATVHFTEEAGRKIVHFIEHK